jgi:hypothetical protein
LSFRSAVAPFQAEKISRIWSRRAAPDGNPKTWNGQAGLVDGGTKRFGGLLAGKPLA